MLSFWLYVTATQLVLGLPVCFSTYALQDKQKEEPDSFLSLLYHWSVWMEIVEPPSLSCPAGPFTILRPQNQEIGLYHEVQKRSSADFEAPKVGRAVLQRAIALVTRSWLWQALAYIHNAYYVNNNSRFIQFSSSWKKRTTGLICHFAHFIFLWTCTIVQCSILTTEHFTILESRNKTIGEFYLDRKYSSIN